MVEPCVRGFFMYGGLMTPLAEQTVQTTAGAVAAATGIGAWLAMAADVALAIFGVPLPVVLAAATGAAGARTFMPAVSYRRALVEGLLWGAGGIFTAQLGLVIVESFARVTIPTGALSGAALLVSAGGQIFVTQEFIESIREAIRRRIDRIGRTGP